MTFLIKPIDLQRVKIVPQSSKSLSQFYEGGWDPLKVNWFDEQHYLEGLSYFGTP